MQDSNSKHLGIGDVAQPTSSLPPLDINAALARAQQNKQAASKLPPLNIDAAMRRADLMRQVPLSAEDRAAPPPVGSEGVIGGIAEFGRGIGRMLGHTARKTAGEAAQYYDPEGGSSALSNWGIAQQRAADEWLQKNPGYKESLTARAKKAEDTFSVRGSMGQAGEMSGMSFGLPILGAGIGGLIGALGGPPGALAGAKIGGLVGGAVTVGGFAGSAGQTTEDEVIKARLERGDTREEAERIAKPAGRKAALIEGFGETVAQIPFLRPLGILKTPVQQNAVRAATKALRSPGATAADLVKIIAAEVGTEIGQEAGQQYVKYEAGAGEAPSFDSVSGVIMPTIIMSLLGGGMAESAGAAQRHALTKTLGDKDASPEARIEAVKQVRSVIKDPEIQRLWMDHALRQVVNNEPVVIADDVFYAEEAARIAEQKEQQQTPAEQAPEMPQMPSPDAGLTQPAPESGYEPRSIIRDEGITEADVRQHIIDQVFAPTPMREFPRAQQARESLLRKHDTGEFPQPEMRLGIPSPEEDADIKGFWDSFNRAKGEEGTPFSLPPENAGLYDRGPKPYGVRSHLKDAGITAKELKRYRKEYGIPSPEEDADAAWFWDSYLRWKATTGGPEGAQQDQKAGSPDGGMQQPEVTPDDGAVPADEGGAGVPPSGQAPSEAVEPETVAPAAEETPDAVPVPEETGGGQGATTAPQDQGQAEPSVRAGPYSPERARGYKSFEDYFNYLNGFHKVKGEKPNAKQARAVWDSRNEVPPQEQSTDAVPDTDDVGAQAEGAAAAPQGVPGAQAASEPGQTVPAADEVAGERQPWEMTRRDWAEVEPYRSKQGNQFSEEGRPDAIVENETGLWRRENGFWYKPGDGTGPFPNGTRLTNPVSIRRLDHAVYVRDAISEGKPVPPEVLAEYPELTTKEGQTTSEKPETPTPQAAQAPTGAEGAPTIVPYKEDRIEVQGDDADIRSRLDRAGIKLKGSKTKNGRAFHKKHEQAIRDALFRKESAEDVYFRKKVEDMSQEEKDEAVKILRDHLLINPKSGAKSVFAYRIAPRRPIQISIDADSLKWVNDNMGHESGDKLLTEIGAALARATDDSYHVSGDEFIGQADTTDEAHALVGIAANDLKDIEIVFERPDGTTVTKRGIEFSYGVGETVEIAENELKKHKQERTAKKQRADRGERPPGVSEKPAARVEDQGGKEGESKGPAEEVKQEPSAQKPEAEEAGEDFEEMVRDEETRLRDGVDMAFTERSAPTYLKGGETERKFFEESEKRRESAYVEAVRRVLSDGLNRKLPRKKTEKIESRHFVDVNPPEKAPIRARVAKTAQDELGVAMSIAPRADARYYLNGVYVDPEKKVLVATDGHRLVMIEGVDIASLPDPKLANGKPEKQEKPYIVDRDGRLVDGKYPDYERVIPTTMREDDSIEFDVEAVASRVAGMVDTLRFSQDGSKSFLGVTLLDGEGNNLFGEEKGIPNQVNVRYLADAMMVLRRLGKTKARIQNKGKHLAPKIMADDVTIVVMPAHGGLEGFTQIDITKPKRIEKQRQTGTIEKASTGTPTTGQTTEQLRANLGRRVGVGKLSAMERLGLVKLVASNEKFPGGAKHRGSGIRALWDGQSAWLAADAIPEGQELGILLHEAGDHAGMQPMLGSQYESLTKQFGQLVDAKDATALRAMDMVPKDTAPQHVASERLAYLIQEVVNADEATLATMSGKVKTLVRQAIAAIRAWFYQTDFYKALEKAGISMQLTPRDISAMARSAVDYAIQQKVDEVMANAAMPDMYSRANLQPAPESEYAEKNRAFREEDVTAWDKTKLIARRMFAPGGTLPRNIHELNIERGSNIGQENYMVRHLVGKLERDVRKFMGKRFSELDDATIALMNEALKTSNPDSVMPNLPEEVRADLYAMRKHISMNSGRIKAMLAKISNDLIMQAGFDREQQQIISEARAEETDETVRAAQLKKIRRLTASANKKQAAALKKAELIDVIAANMDTYVHTSHEAFDNKKWFTQVTDEVADAARRYLIDRYEAEGETREEAEALAERMIWRIVKNGTAYDDVFSFVTDPKLGAKDLSVLMHKKNIAPEIRALLGEYKDPRINFAKTINKMGRFLWNQDFLFKVREAGLGVFLFESDKAPPSATAQIADERDDRYSPLSGLYTTPELAKSFAAATDREHMENWYRTIVRINGLIKVGKTVGSPTTALRNFQAGMFFVLANGHFDLTHIGKAASGFKEYFTQLGDDEKIAYLAKLYRLGVIYDSPHGGELKRIIADSRLEELFQGKSAKLAGAFKWISDNAQDFYSYGDDFWKIIGFENEKALLMEAGMSEVKAEKEAAERIRNTYPTYSLAGHFPKQLSRFPLAGTFVLFPAEIIRTSANMFRYMVHDLKTPGLRKLGLRRAAGLSIVSSLAFAAQELSKSMLGIDDDEEEAVRLLAAPWSANANLLFWGRDEKGNLQYFDLSFLDPYGYWKRPINAMLRDQPWEDKLKQSAEEALTPFFGTDIAAEAILEVFSNKKADTGTKVYSEFDNTWDITMDIADHLRKNLQPGIASNVERTLKALRGEMSPSGRKYEIVDEAAAWGGWRVSTLDPKAALYYRSYEFKDAKREAAGRLSRMIRDPNDISASELKSAYELTLSLRQRAYDNFSKIVYSARESGLSNTQIRRILKLSGISPRDATALLRGETVPWNPSKVQLRNAIKKAKVLFEPNVTDRIVRRYESVTGF